MGETLQLPHGEHTMHSIRLRLCVHVAACWSLSKYLALNRPFHHAQRLARRGPGSPCATGVKIKSACAKGEAGFASDCIRNWDVRFSSFQDHLIVRGCLHNQPHS